MIIRPHIRLWGGLAAAFGLLAGVAAVAQSTGEVQGVVKLKETGGALHGAQVLVVELGRATITDAEGRYAFRGVPPGRYHVISHLDSIFTEAAQIVNVATGGVATADFTLELTALRHEITVTTGAKQQTAFESFQSVDSLDSFELAESTDVSLGESLGNRVGTGVSKRSFGPGSSRPIIRGFDGDRVLIMQDGVRTGTLGSQSGDHGEAVNLNQVDRVEIVKGPATLLYGSNAMGGTVNAISRHHSVHSHAHQGLRGSVSGSAGTANALGVGNAGFEYGQGPWVVWGSGGGLRAGDYRSPIGEIFNSRTRNTNAGGGLGYYGDKLFVSFGVQQDDGVNGVPFATAFEQGGEGSSEGKEEEIERIALESERQSYELNWGLREMKGKIESFVLKLRLIDWHHDEVEFLEGGAKQVGTSFDQRQFIYRGVFEQAARGPLTGRFGFWGRGLSYEVTGEEALAPAVDQTAFALFGLEEIEFERIKFQLGGRLETNRYRPGTAERLGAPAARERSFTGASASAGVHADLWKGGAFVTNYSHSSRAPALEELFNFGPHIGNLAFEIGSPDLKLETGDGLDLSLRHEEGRVRGEVNFFYYGFNNFVFPFATGEIEDGLRVIKFTQRDARFVGGEANLNLGLHKSVWLNLGLDAVDARETVFDTPLPRIPPLRGRIGLDLHYKNLSLKPELLLADDQDEVFTAETRTAGFATLNLKASYTIPQRHLAHQFSVNVFNIADRLYRNHASFIKDLAPEIGRGVRFTYVMRFF